MKIFTDDFVNKTSNILKSKCFGPNSLFKKELAREIGFSEDDPKKFNIGLNLISAMFEMGYFEEYKILPGKHGGIIHEPTFYKSTSQIFPENFLQCLFDVLIKNCDPGPIPRNKIAKEMKFNLTEDQICNLISTAFQKKYIIGFLGKTGKNGGIVKSNIIEPKLNIQDSFWEEVKNLTTSNKNKIIANIK
jgi:hypothetical protein